ncbi:hypothetical protein B0H13DRAFT_1935327 [Mycena leptocephala]|nr:hypothetical protein B0H13DRAFT_1935327 [Mycena leptocephala]
MNFLRQRREYMPEKSRQNFVRLMPSLTPADVLHGFRCEVQLLLFVSDLLGASHVIYAAFLRLYGLALSSPNLRNQQLKCTLPPVSTKTDICTIKCKTPLRDSRMYAHPARHNALAFTAPGPSPLSDGPRLLFTGFDLHYSQSQNAVLALLAAHGCQHPHIAPPPSERLGASSPADVVFLSVGRLSPEKNLGLGVWRVVRLDVVQRAPVFMRLMREGVRVREEQQRFFVGGIRGVWTATSDLVQVAGWVRVASLRSSVETRTRVGLLFAAGVFVLSAPSGSLDQACALGFASRLDWIGQIGSFVCLSFPLPILYRDDGCARDRTARVGESAACFSSREGVAFHNEGELRAWKHIKVARLERGAPRALVVYGTLADEIYIRSYAMQRRTRVRIPARATSHVLELELSGGPTQLHDLQREERKDEEASGWQKSYTKFQNGEINIHNWKYWNSYLGRSENLKDQERQGAPAMGNEVFGTSYGHR